MKKNSEKPQSAVKIKLGPISIQWLASTPGPCSCCGARVGSGPVGFKADEPAGPLCDSCLLERNTDLGMLLILANMTRELANQPSPDDPSATDLPKLALMTFSTMYDQAARWPRRWRAARNFLRDLLTQLAEVPIDTVIRMMEGDTH